MSLVVINEVTKVGSFKFKHKIKVIVLIEVLELAVLEFFVIEFFSKPKFNLILRLRFAY